MSKPRDLFRDGFTAEDFIYGSAEANAQIANLLLRQALEQSQTVYTMKAGYGGWDERRSKGLDTHEAKLVAVKKIEQQRVLKGEG